MALSSQKDSHKIGHGCRLHLTESLDPTTKPFFVCWYYSWEGLSRLVVAVIIPGYHRALGPTQGQTLQ